MFLRLICQFLLPGLVPDRRHLLSLTWLVALTSRTERGLFSVSVLPAMVSALSCHRPQDTDTEYRALRPSRQFSSNRWKAAGALVRPNGPLIHSYDPGGPPQPRRLDSTPPRSGREKQEWPHTSSGMSCALGISCRSGWFPV